MILNPIVEAQKNPEADDEGTKVELAHGELYHGERR